MKITHYFFPVILLMSLSLIAPLPLSAQIINKALPWQQLMLVGEARLSFLVWPVYEARLYSDSGNFEFTKTFPFALALEYKRQFSKEQLVEETRKQWQALGLDTTSARYQQWLTTLATLFRDVDKEDVITLYVDEQAHSSFYFNEQLLGTIKHAGFSQQFAAIWLSENTTRPEFTNKLLRKKS